MKHKLWVVILVIIAVILGFFGVARATYTTVTCVRPGVWLVTNSESDRALTFTTTQGPSGSIPAGGSLEVSFSGDRLTVTATWTGGKTRTDTGTGNCTIPVTVPPTTIPVTTTSTTTTLPVTTTAAPVTTLSPPTTVRPTTTTIKVVTPVQTQWSFDCLGVNFTGTEYVTVYNDSNGVVFQGFPPVHVDLDPGNYFFERMTAGGNFRTPVTFAACIPTSTTPGDTSVTETTIIESQPTPGAGGTVVINQTPSADAPEVGELPITGTREIVFFTVLGVFLVLFGFFLRRTARRPA